MAVNLGSTPIANIYIGNTQIQNVYLGNSLIYSAVNAIQAIINNFKTRVANDGGTFEAESNLLSILNSVNSSIGLSKVNMLLTPNAFKAGKAYNVIGQTDFAVLRNTDATRVNSAGLVELQGSNIMRIDYRSGTPMILDEVQRTNLVTYNSDLSNAAWLIIGSASVTLNAGTAPDGTNTAVRISGGGGVINTYNPTNVLNHSRSIYAKTVSGTGNTNLLSFNGNSNSLFNITNDWKKFELNSYSATGANNIYGVDFRNAASTLSEILIWRPQAEVGALASTSITTLASAVTRNEDVLTVTPPAGTVRITTTFLDNTTQVLNTMPATFTLPPGQIRQVVFQSSL